MDPALRRAARGAASGVLLGVMLAHVPVAAQPPDPGRALRRSDARPAGESLYRNSWAVVVGVDDYASWPRLSYAAADARAIHDILIDRFQFPPANVTLLLNRQATKKNILEAIGDRLSDTGRVGRNDRVFIFFAGHGATRRLPAGGALGYIIPVDADRESYTSQAISMSNFRDIADQIPAKHVFFVIDACYGGLALTRAGSAYGDEVTRRSARQILTAGGADEEVADNGPGGHSIFTWTLMQALSGRGDLNGDGYVAASEIYAFLGPAVSGLSRQTPAFGWMAGSEGGDFVFALPRSQALDLAAEEADPAAVRLNAEIDRLRAENERLRRRIDGVPAASAPAVSPRPAPPSGGSPAAAAASERGLTLSNAGRYADALPAFREAFDKSPNAVDAANVGFMYYKLGQLPEAIDWMQRSLALDPKRAITHGNLGYAFIAAKRYEEGRAALRKYLAMRPTGRTADMVRKTLQEIEGK